MTAMVDIKPLDAAAEPAWEAFVEAAPDATFFHRVGWARVIAKAYGHPTYFRYASRGGRVVGVLPLVHVKSPLFGNALISTAFCTFGGIAATDRERRWPWRRTPRNWGRAWASITWNCATRRRCQLIGK